MNRHSLCFALAALLASAPALAAPASPVAPATKAVTDEEVGDADSFGRGMNWLGLLSGYVRLELDCTPAPGDPADPNCVTLNPAPAATSFNLANLDSITLPGRSSHSLLCHWQTPLVNLSFSNTTGARQFYRFQAAPTYRIESAVLDGLTDPNTGLPFGGAIEIALTAMFRSGTIDDGEFHDEVVSGARMCIGGLVSRRSLVESYGLTEAQARRFFREPITIRFGIRGSAQMMDGAGINFGTRLAGD